MSVQKRGPTLKARALRSLKGFCDSTGIHGCAYFFGGSRNLYELCFWLIIVLCSLTFATVIIAEVFSDWRKSPIHDVVSSFNMRPKDVPFPVIVICAQQEPDELYLLSQHLNQYEFQCWKGQCDGTDAIRSAPYFRQLLRIIMDYIDTESRALGGFIDWFAYYSFAGQISMDEVIKDPDLISVMLAMMQGQEQTGFLPDRFGPQLPKDEMVFTYGPAILILKAIGFGLGRHEIADFWRPLFQVDEIDSLVQEASVEYLALSVKSDVKSEAKYIADHVPFFPNSACPDGLCHYNEPILHLMKVFTILQHLGQVPLGSLLHFFFRHLTEQEKIAIGQDMAGFLNVSSSTAARLNLVRGFVSDEGHQSILSYFINESYTGSELTATRDIVEAMSQTTVLSLQPEDRQQRIRALVGEASLGFPFISSYAETSEEDIAYKVDDNLDPLINDIRGSFMSLLVYIEQAMQDFGKAAFLSIFNTHKGPLEAFSLNNNLELIQLCTFTDSLVNTVDASTPCTEHVVTGCDCHASFHTEFTALGMCNVFNGAALSSVFKDSTFNEIRTALAVEKSSELEHLSLRELSGMTLILDTHGLDLSQGQSSRGLVLGVASQNSYVNFVGNMLKLSGGLQVTLTIRATAFEADEALLAEARSERNCAYPHEISPDSIFRQYSQEHCIFEEEFAQLTGEWSCAPWYLSPLSSDHAVCNESSSAAFEEDMKHALVRKSSPNCLPNCVFLEYLLHVDSKLTNSDEQCLDKSVYLSLYYDTGFAMFKSFQSFLLGYMQGERALPKYCRHKLENDVVLVDIRVSKYGIKEIRKAYTANGLDVVRLIGGSVGLFTGASLFLLIEVFIWGLNIFMKIYDSDFTHSGDDNVIQCLMAYLKISTLHGMFFLPGMRSLWVILPTSAALITFFAIPSKITVDTFQLSPLKSVTDFQESALVQYPTISICPVQYSHRFNLPRVLLNTADDYSEKDVHLLIEQFESYDWLNVLDFSILGEAQIAGLEDVIARHRESQDPSTTDVCEDGWIYLEETSACYKFQSVSPLRDLATPKANHESCENIGNLAIIESEEELAFLTGHIEQNDPSGEYILGAFEASERGMLLWYLDDDTVPLKTDLWFLDHKKGERPCFVYFYGQIYHVPCEMEVDRALCSAACTEELAPDVLTDGLYTSFWASSTQDQGEWVNIELPQPQAISSVHLTPEIDSPFSPCATITVSSSGQEALCTRLGQFTKQKMLCHEETCLFAVHNVTRQEALSECERQGAFWAYPTSIKEDQLFTELLHTTAWLPLTYKDNGHFFMGSPFNEQDITFLEHAPEDPEDVGSFVTLSPDGSWESIQSQSPRMDAICQILPDFSEHHLIWRCLEDTCYGWKPTVKMSPLDAKRVCESLGGNLPVIHNQDELDLITGMSFAGPLMLGTQIMKNESDVLSIVNDDHTPYEFDLFKKFNEVAYSKFPWRTHLALGVALNNLLLVRMHDPVNLMCQAKISQLPNEAMKFSYWIASDTAQTFADGKEMCEEQGGNLITLHSHYEEKFALALSKGKDFWIGLSGLDSGQLSQLDGTPLVYENWNNSATRIDLSSRSQIYYSKWNSRWFSVDESDMKKLSVICKKPYKTQAYVSCTSDSCSSFRNEHMTFNLAEEACSADGGEMVEMVSSQDMHSYKKFLEPYAQPLEIWIHDDSFMCLSNQCQWNAQTEALFNGDESLCTAQCNMASLGQCQWKFSLVSGQVECSAPDQPLASPLCHWEILKEGDELDGHNCEHDTSALIDQIRIEKSCSSGQALEIREIDLNGDSGTDKSSWLVTSSSNKVLQRDEYAPQSCFKTIREEEGFPALKAEEKCQSYGMSLGLPIFNQLFQLFPGLDLYSLHWVNLKDSGGQLTYFDNSPVPDAVVANMALIPYGLPSLWRNFMRFKQALYLDRSGALKTKTVPLLSPNKVLCKYKMSIKRVNEMIKTDNSDWKRYCLKHTACKNLIIQELKGFELRREEIGSLLEHFTEILVNSSFHAQGLYGENKLIVDRNNEAEEAIYELLEGLFIKTLDEAGDADQLTSFAISELPTLQESLDHELMNTKSFTPRERTSRKVYHVHRRMWEQSFGPGGYRLSISPFAARVVELFLWDTSLRVLADGKRMLEDKIEEFSAIDGDTRVTLTKDTGQDLILEAYANNTYGKLLSSNLMQVLKVMRFSTVQGRPGVNSSRMEQLFPRFNFRADAPIFDETNRLDMVKHCAFEGSSGSHEDCSMWLTPALTSEGVCSSFNGYDVEELLTQDNQYINMFKEVFIDGPSNDQIMRLSDFFTLPKLTLVLDIHRSDIQGTERGQYILAFNEALDVHDMHSYPVNIQPGTHVSIELDASIYDLDKAAESYSVQERNCILKSEEKQLLRKSIFKHYTMSSCQFNCALKVASTNMSCVPWDFIHLKDDYPLCVREDAVFFRNILTSGSVLQGCDCREACKRTTFTHSTDTKTMDPLQMCHKAEIHEAALKEIKNPVDHFAWVHSRISKWQYNTRGFILPFDSMSRCEHKVQNDLAYVLIQMKSYEATTTELAVRYSFIDQLSIFGGNFGLFIGMSLISVIEIIYWLYLLLKQTVSDEINQD